MTIQDFKNLYQLEIPIGENGIFWNGKPDKYSNLNYGLDFTQKFGMNLLNYGQFGMAGHNGIDIAGQHRTPIVAPCKMWVSWVEKGGNGYGNFLFAETETKTLNGDTGKLQLCFAHFDEIIIKPYHWVERGTIIGYMGNTGWSTGTHLHFGIRPYYKEGNDFRINDNGYKGYVDPEQFLPHIVWGREELINDFNIQKFMETNDKKLVFNNKTGEIGWLYNSKLRIPAKDRLPQMIASYLIRKEGVNLNNDDWDKLNKEIF